MKRKTDETTTRITRRRVKKVDEEEEQEEFLSKCYMLNLPGDWKEEVEESDMKGISKPTQRYMNEEYFTIRRLLINKSITIDNILEMKNLTPEDKADLLERYGILRSMDMEPKHFIAYRNKLLEDIQAFENTTLEKRKDIIQRRKQIQSVVDDTEERILNLNLREHDIKVIHSKFLKFSDMTPYDNEYFKLKDWMSVVINLPYGINRPLRLKTYTIEGFLKNAKDRLDAKLYGMQNIKENILLLLSHKLLNPDASNISLALVGPPGVGKTEIIKSMADIFDIPYEHISMGGVNDVSYLGGHSYTYEGARPGKIVTSIQRMGCTNGILFFDEVDKIGTSTHGLEVTNQLIHITDFTQNMYFQDKYMPEIPIDLSKMWFMFSLNNQGDVNPVLLNRLRLVQVSGYTNKDKFKILHNHLIPNCYNQYAVKIEDYTFTDEVMTYIIDKTPKEEGVRELKRTIELIFARLQLAKCIDTTDGAFGFKVQKSNGEGYELTKKDIDSIVQHKEEIVNPSLSMLYL